MIWPWEAAVTREPIIEMAGASIRVPTQPGGGPAPDPLEEGKPRLVADPSTGELSRIDANNNLIPGTTITLTGTGFKPGVPVELWWRDPLRNAFQLREGGNYLSVRAGCTGGPSRPRR